ncbi:putative glyceraldehyde 3-phosphate dehydrogenase, cytosolic [Trypanosoma cruzi]|uniref:Putative glyceraldehyde 3-phosphate dehydrogenase, cytosolic n=1 Tax=Trypanosoma cruzi TaxID=5693 RepID=A0A2V2VCZ3_TRYCR|nr:putative glyceraldehyde 3-phosphate dehydrogenase, cytosolic [Trypanosoma cruzi]
MTGRVAPARKSRQSTVIRATPAPTCVFRRGLRISHAAPARTPPALRGALQYALAAREGALFRRRRGNPRDERARSRQSRAGRDRHGGRGRVGGPLPHRWDRPRARPGRREKTVMTGQPGDDTPMLFVGVNDAIDRGQRIASKVLCAKNRLAPPAEIAHERFGAVEGLMTTARATMASQQTADGASLKDWRGGRGAAQNIIPSATGAAKAVGKVIPALNGRLAGMAFRVPTPNVSVVDLTSRLEKPAAYGQLRAAIKAASKGKLNGLLGRTEGEVVSSEMNGVAPMPVFDVKAGISLNDRFAKLASWYDDGTGYSHKVLDLVALIPAHRSGRRENSEKKQQRVWRGRRERNANKKGKNVYASNEIHLNAK